MKINPKYTDYENAPKIYYYILRYGLWLLIALVIYTFFLIFGRIPISYYFTSEFIIMDVMIVAEIVALFFCIKAALGLRKREWSGVKALYISLIVTIIAYLIIIIAALIMGRTNYGDFDIVAPIIIELALIGLSILTWVYFEKRRLLFYPYAYEYEMADVNIKDAQEQNHNLLNPEKTDFVIEKKDIGTSMETRENNKPKDVDNAAEDLKEVEANDEIKEENGLANDFADAMFEESERPYDNVAAETEDTIEDDEIRFCYKCGHEIGPNAVFCEKCGTRVR